MFGCAALETGTAIDRTVGVGKLTFQSNTHQLGFQLRNANVGSLTFNWTRQGDAWKIVGFHLVTD